MLELVERGRHPHHGLFRTWSRTDEEAVASALERTDLVHLAAVPVDSLSGGQRQRVWLAMVLAQATPVLLLDEPTSFLDIAHQLDVLDLVRRLCDESGTTVVMVLHDLAMAARYADHLVAMRDGRVVAEGPPADGRHPRGDRGGLRRHRHGARRPGLGRPRRHPPQEDPVTTTAEPLVRTDTPQFEATVVAVADLGGGMRRVTCAAEGLRSFVPCGPDEYVGLLMPPVGRAARHARPRAGERAGLGGRHRGCRPARAALVHDPRPRPRARPRRHRHHDPRRQRTRLGVDLPGPPRRPGRHPGQWCPLPGPRGARAPGAGGRRDGGAVGGRHPRCVGRRRRRARPGCRGARRGGGPGRARRPTTSAT